MMIQMRHNIRIHYMFQKFAGYAGQGNWTIVASKRPVSLFLTGDKCLLKTILWGYHPSLLTVEKDVQKQDLAQMSIS